MSVSIVEHQIFLRLIGEQDGASIKLQEISLIMSYILLSLIEYNGVCNSRTQCVELEIGCLNFIWFIIDITLVFVFCRRIIKKKSKILLQQSLRFLN